MEKIFFHGTGDSDYAFENMLKIIETGGIKSLKMQNSDEQGFVNGQNYISLCAWDEDVNHDISKNKSSFNGWIFGCPCFIIRGIDAIKCDKYHPDYNPEEERVSQYEDEWHAKDFIPLENIIGIALPFKDEEFINRNKEKVDKILKYANEYNWQIFESDESLIENTNNLKRRR